MILRKFVGALMVGGASLPAIALATNGMDMEGYGPVATAMGGASFAYDNGSAAMMNNPATIGLMGSGHRFDFAYGFLGPGVAASFGSQSSKSTADAFSMPAFGWLSKRGAVTYGFGIYGQGGMGTEYKGDSFMSAGTGLTTRSELGVGRVLFPLAVDVNPDLTIGATLDYVWAGLDLQMAMSRQQIDGLQAGNLGSVSGSLAPALVGMLPDANDVGYFNFSNQNRFTGQATSRGFAGKIGFVYKMNSQLNLGATYHSKTRLSDMQARQAEVRAVDGATGAAVSMPGRITVRNFQWPETYGLGIAYQANERVLLVADLKRINWADVMKDFKMTFEADAGGVLDLTLNQFWKNQNVLMLGGSYKANDALTLRAGLNLANNPVPDYYMHPLFPAIVRNHVTAGFGYALGKNAGIDFAFTHAPEVAVTNGSGATVSHSQNNWQLMFSYFY